jgi:branched-chain amino acid transport system substrate-binding protein
MKPNLGLALTAIGLVGLAACGSSSGGGTTANKGTIKIGVELPESGKEASNGLPTLNGVKFAVQKVGSIKGFTLAVENKDDAVNGSHDATKGAQNIRDLVADNQVLGVVGPFNSSVAQAEIPVANAANLTIISPANTSECLTQSFAPPECAFKPSDLRPNGKNNYFRVAATDTLQGPAMADYAYAKLSLKNVAVASDNQTYGKGIAQNFAKEFVTKGGKIAGPEHDIDSKSTNDFKSLLNSMKAAGADGLYFGGTDSDNVCVARQQMKGVGLDVPFMGGDGIVTGQCIKDAADNVDNMFGTVAAVDATQLPAAKSLIDEFKKSFSSPSDFGAYTMPAYDCAKILIDAIGRAIDDAGGNTPSRDQVRAQVAKTTNYQGALGTIGFDSNGDTTNRIISVYKIGAAPGLTGSTPKDWVWVSQVKK